MRPFSPVPFTLLEIDAQFARRRDARPGLHAHRRNPRRQMPRVPHRRFRPPGLRGGHRRRCDSAAGAWAAAPAATAATAAGQRALLAAFQPQHGRAFTRPGRQSSPAPLPPCRLAAPAHPLSPCRIPASASGSSALTGVASFTWISMIGTSLKSPMSGTLTCRRRHVALPCLRVRPSSQRCRYLSRTDAVRPWSDRAFPDRCRTSASLAPRTAAANLPSSASAFSAATRHVMAVHLEEAHAASADSRERPKPSVPSTL